MNKGYLFDNIQFLAMQWSILKNHRKRCNFKALKIINLCQPDRHVAQFSTDFELPCSYWELCITPLIDNYVLLGAPIRPKWTGPLKRANPELFEAVRPSFQDLVSKAMDGSKSTYKKVKRGYAKLSDWQAATRAFMNFWSKKGVPGKLLSGSCAKVSTYRVV